MRSGSVIVTSKKKLKVPFGSNGARLWRACGFGATHFEAAFVVVEGGEMALDIGLDLAWAHV